MGASLGLRWPSFKASRLKSSAGLGPKDRSRIGVQGQANLGFRASTWRVESTFCTKCLVAGVLLGLGCTGGVSLEYITGVIWFPGFQSGGLPPWSVKTFGKELRSRRKGFRVQEFAALLKKHLRRTPSSSIYQETGPETNTKAHHQHASARTPRSAVIEKLAMQRRMDHARLEEAYLEGVCHRASLKP